MTTRTATLRTLTRTGLTVAGLATAGVAAAIIGPATAAHAADAPVVAGAPMEHSLNHDFQLQENGYYCGPSATRVALSAQGKVFTQDDVAAKLGTTVNGTNSANDITRALNTELGEGRYTTHEIAAKPTPEQTQQYKVDIVTAINAGKPVVANIAGTTTDDNGENHSYAGGHYIPVVGYSHGGDTVLIADSADKIGSPVYTLSTDSLAQWTATRGYSA